MNCRFEKTDGTNPDFVRMCRKLDDFLNDAVGGEKQRSQYIQYNTLESIHDVLVIYDGEKCVGAGSYKRYDDETVELKRIYVDECARGQGLGSALISRLELDAKRHGYSYAVLETGAPLVAASAMYRKLGYEVIANYGQYAGMEDSICMKKAL